MDDELVQLAQDLEAIGLADMFWKDYVDGKIVEIIRDLDGKIQAYVVEGCENNPGWHYHQLEEDENGGSYFCTEKFALQVKVIDWIPTWALIPLPEEMETKHWKTWRNA